VTSQPAVGVIVGCPGLACACCGAGLGVEQVTAALWAWVHAGTRPPACPGLAVPAASVVYLLHLVPAYRHARHYLGFAASSGFLPRRLHEHATGRGARLVAVALAAGCRFELVRLWPGSRDDERRLKNQRAVPRLLCPACPTRAQARRLAGQCLLPDPMASRAVRPTTTNP
jgi:hypothetical protein